MLHQIEKGVPAPFKGTRRTKYPFADMEVGDSFLTAEDRSRVSSSAAVAGKRHGKKFSLAATPEGLRVWRVA